MSYENSPQCVMLATHCCVCGRPLVDAISVELGIGPDCRDYNNQGIDEDTQKAANVLTHRAAVAAEAGYISTVLEIAEEIRQLGLPVLADRVASRFIAAERKVKVTVSTRNGMLIVKTPYRRGMAADFIEAWRAIPGRRWNGLEQANLVPVESKRHLWALLTRFFPGQYGRGDKGLFRIPSSADADAA